MVKVCCECGKRTNNNKYCSRVCACQAMTIGRKGASSWNKGKKLSKALSIAQKNRFEKEPVWNKGKKGYFSKESLARINTFKPGHIPWSKGRSPSADARLEHIKRCVFEGGQVSPTYNTIACKFFDWFDDHFQTTGQYAKKSGEYLIQELGYFVDYFNPTMRIIIEWDEERNHYRNGKLKNKDIQRQNEIMKHFPGYELSRIREKEFDISKLYEEVA